MFISYPPAAPMSPSVDSDGILLSPSLAPTESPIPTPPTLSRTSPDLELVSEPFKDDKSPANRSNKESPIVKPLRPTLPQPPVIVTHPTERRGRTLSRTPSPLSPNYRMAPIYVPHSRSPSPVMQRFSPIPIPVLPPTMPPTGVPIIVPPVTQSPIRVYSRSHSRQRYSRTPDTSRSSRSRSRSHSRPRRHRRPRSPRKPAVRQPWYSPLPTPGPEPWMPPGPAPFIPAAVPPVPAYPPFCSPWATMSPKHHHRFFFADGNVAFQMKDGTIYKVHRIFFTQNSDMLSALMSPFTVSNPEWNPVHLWDVEPKAFELLLSIFYPKDYLTSEIETVEDWTLLLSLASKYQMKKIRDLAINRLGSLASPVDKIALANEHNIKEWLVPAYAELCTRFEPLTLEEGKKLGVEAMVKLEGLKHDIKENLVKFLDTEKVSKAVESKLESQKKSK